VGGQDQVATFATTQFTKVRPIKPAAGATALNKTGRLVLYGEHAGQAEKIYEAASAEHARFIEAVSAHRRLAGCFPCVRSLHGRFLVVRWAENYATQTPPVPPLAELISRIHATSVSELPPAGFDYWHDLIRPRFVRAAELLSISELTPEPLARIDSAWGRSPKHLMHPDVTPDNAVRTSDGLWQLIDNELLTVGGLPIIDLCNSAYALGAKAGQELVDTYLAQTGNRLSSDDVSILNDFWFARRLGSEFVAGNIAGANLLLERYRMKRDILPANFQSASMP
jgi:hypothetical protein